MQIEKIYTQELPIYGYTIKVVVTTDINHSRKKRDKQFGREWQNDSAIRGLHSPFENHPMSYVFFADDATVNEIGHESMHVTQRIVEWIGATYSDKEFVAYLQGYLTGSFHDFVEQFKNYHKKLDKKAKTK